MERLETEHGVFENNQVTGQTAQEVYNEWLENRDKPPEPTEIEIIGQEVTRLKLSNIQKDSIINILGQELAIIKLQLLQGGEN